MKDNRIGLNNILKGDITIYKDGYSLTEYDDFDKELINTIYGKNRNKYGIDMSDELINGNDIRLISFAKNRIKNH